MFIRVLLILV